MTRHVGKHCRGNPAVDKANGLRPGLTVGDELRLRKAWEATYGVRLPTPPPLPPPPPHRRDYLEEAS